MRWTLGNYTLKYNPKTLNKTWSPLSDVNMNVNGQISNPNLMFNGTQNFSIDVYEHPTSSTITPMTGSYIGATEKRTNEYMFLLKTGGVFDVKGKDNTLYGTHTIVSGNGVTLPNAKPNSLVHFDTAVAFVCPDINQSSLLITDENGVAKSKYIYSTDDLKFGTSITWDYNSSFLILNPYGGIYSVNTSNGSESLLYQFSDYQTNLTGNIKRYTSIIMFEKNSRYYIGVLRDTKDIVFLDYSTLNIMCKADTGLSNILAVCYSNYSGDSYTVLSNKINQTTFNTCRIDVELIKGVISNGQFEVIDEDGFPCIVSPKSMSVTRDPNSNEARYEVQLDATIMYSNTGFGNNWTKNSRNF